MNKAIQEYAEAYAVYWALGEPEEGMERERFLKAQIDLEAPSAITHDSIRAAGGIVHSDGNIFFRNIEQARAAIAAQAKGKQA